MIKAEYLDHMGTDLSVVNAARVSMDKESFEFTLREILAKGSDEGLIEYLATHNHWTPFSHVFITLRETVPIFVARQRFKHMVGFTYNETSRRYVDDAPSFHVPTEWRKRPDGSIKQGSGAGIVESLAGGISIHTAYDDFIDHAERLYQEMIDAKVAPEQARMVLPQSMLTSYWVSGSVAAFARAYQQRVDSHAQEEIQVLAHQWGDIIEPLFPHSWKALVQHG